MMRLTRLELVDVGQWDRLEVDLHARTVIRGQNAAGKSTIIRALMCLVGASGESAQALVRTDEAGVPVEGAVPQIVGYLEGDGERYKITRRAKKLIVQRWENDNWRSLEPPDKELQRIFDRDSSPSALLDERLSDDKRIGLVLEVAEAAGYDRAEALRIAFDAPLGAFTLQPIPAGLHPLEDLEKVIGQVFDARTDVERQRKAAASAADRLATGLTADAPENVSERVVDAQEAVDSLRRLLHKIVTDNEAADAKIASDMRIEVGNVRAETAAKLAEINAACESRIQTIQSTASKLQGQVNEAAEVARKDAFERVAAATAELAELRTTQEIVVADKARRDESEKARAEAQALAARHAALTRAIQSLKTQAAQFISDSFPGVKVDIDDSGKRVLMVHGDNGWKTWGSTNTGRLQEIGAQWSVLHQDKRGAQGVPMLGLVLLDRGESLDPVKIDALGAAGQLIVTLRTPGELTFEEA